MKILVGRISYVVTALPNPPRPPTLTCLTLSGSSTNTKYTSLIVPPVLAIRKQCSIVMAPPNEPEPDSNAKDKDPTSTLDRQAKKRVQNRVAQRTYRMCPRFPQSTYLPTSMLDRPVGLLTGLPTTGKKIKAHIANLQARVELSEAIVQSFNEGNALLEDDTDEIDAMVSGSRATTMSRPASQNNNITNTFCQSTETPLSIVHDACRGNKAVTSPSLPDVRHAAEPGTLLTLAVTLWLHEINE